MSELICRNNSITIISFKFNRFKCGINSAKIIYFSIRINSIFELIQSEIELELESELQNKKKCHDWFKNRFFQVNHNTPNWRHKSCWAWAVGRADETFLRLIYRLEQKKGRYVECKLLHGCRWTDGGWPHFFCSTMSGIIKLGTIFRSILYMLRCCAQAPCSTKVDFVRHPYKF